jgi:hypothetical protein
MVLAYMLNEVSPEINSNEQSAGLHKMLCVLKLDMMKAYLLVEWDYLTEMLIKLDLRELFVHGTFVSHNVV